MKAVLKLVHVQVELDRWWDDAQDTTSDEAGDYWADVKVLTSIHHALMHAWLSWVSPPRQRGVHLHAFIRLSYCLPGG